MLHISLEHRYFTNQASNQLFEWKPTATTRQWFHKMPLFVKIKPNEIRIVPDEDELPTLGYFLEKQPDLSFTFELYSKDANWVACSRLPTSFSPQRHVLYFSNRYPTENYQGLLHQGKAVGESELYLTKTLQELEALSSDEAKLLPADQANHLLPDSTSAASPENVTNLPEGRYFLMKKGAIADRLMYWQHHRVQRPIGLIEINLHEAMSQQWLQCINTQRHLPTYRYKMIWESPRSYWRYLCLPYQTWSQDRVDSMHIVCDELPLNFGQPVILQQANGQVVYAFVSDKALPLRDQYPFALQLKANESSSEQNRASDQDYVFTLPMAHPQHTYRTSESDYMTDIAVRI